MKERDCFVGPTGVGGTGNGHWLQRRQFNLHVGITLLTQEQLRDRRDYSECVGSPSLLFRKSKLVEKRC